MRCELEVIVWVVAIAITNMNTLTAEFQLFFNFVICDSYAIIQECWTDKPQERPDFSELVVTISLTLEAVAGYMSLNTTSQNIIDGNRDEHPVVTGVEKADLSASSLSLSSPEEDEHPFAT